MKKAYRIFAALCALPLAAGFFACSPPLLRNRSGAAVAIVAADESQFAPGDYGKPLGEYDATIMLSGATATLSDASFGNSGTVATVTRKGVYKVSGTGDGASIVVDSRERGNVYLIFDGVNLTSPGACLTVLNSSKTIIQCVGDNVLSSTAAEPVQEGSFSINGAIYSRTKLAVCGEGTLEVNSALHGVVVKDDLRITGASITVNAGKRGFDVNDSFRMGGGKTVVYSGSDGVRVSNKKGDSYAYMDGGSLEINSAGDGLCASGPDGCVKLAGGSVKIASGGGSGMAKGQTSSKGIKSDGAIEIGKASVEIDSNDDAINSASAISFAGGDVKVKSGDDAIASDGEVLVSAGTVSVITSVKGVEAAVLNVIGGSLSVVASDGGVSAGVKDESGKKTGGKVLISGGTIDVTAGGDGVDAHGSIYVSGGVTVIKSGAGAVVKGDGEADKATVSGGVVLAAGKKEKATNFDSGKSCSALIAVSLSGASEVSFGSGFTYSLSGEYDSLLYSSPFLSFGGKQTLSVNGEQKSLDFTRSLYYTALE